MNTTTPKTETANAEPCPYCGRLHECGGYIERPDLTKPGSGMAYAPADKQCECGALLRHSVPLFKMSATGWVWRRIDPPAKLKLFIVSAARDGVELAHTRQRVTDEETAKRITYARNKAEPQGWDGKELVRGTLWGYYPATESDLESMREADGHVEAGEEATRPPYDC